MILHRSWRKHASPCGPLTALLREWRVIRLHVGYKLMCLGERISGIEITGMSCQMPGLMSGTSATANSSS